ncbi:Peptidase S10, serine carboxypeptidase [Artemisia annua]|uniref:Peptidase S10, serine carboxypeptidase n=1 Tax=Artemisia annua TaxID=35608 RepID=A0A2U1MIV9_ARTAN|nr:Peptidase S10, serine carboxypeptidase [Artemisia annua]
MSLYCRKLGKFQEIRDGLMSCLGLVRIMKNYGPLTFLDDHNAGHMVPMDQPSAALQMKQCEGSLCHNFSNMKDYLSESLVKTALGVPSDIYFVSCSDTVHQAMLQDWMRDLEVEIPALSEQGIELPEIRDGRVNSMPWSGQNKFVAASNVHNAGHMVPMDQPSAAPQLLSHKCCSSGQRQNYSTMKD